MAIFSDHILEAQTVAKALRKAGYKTTGYVDQGPIQSGLTVTAL